MGDEDEDDVLQFSIQAITAETGVRTDVNKIEHVKRKKENASLVAYSSSDSEPSSDEDDVGIGTPDDAVQHELSKLGADEPEVKSAQKKKPNPRKRVRFAETATVHDIRPDSNQPPDLDHVAEYKAISRIFAAYEKASTTQTEGETLDDDLQKFKEDIKDDLDINVEEDDIALAEAEDKREEQFQNEFKRRITELRSLVQHGAEGRQRPMQSIIPGGSDNDDETAAPSRSTLSLRKRRITNVGILEADDKDDASDEEGDSDS